MEIFPLFGRKKKITLNRTTCTFREAGINDLSVGPLEVALPSVKKSENSYQLTLLEGEIDVYSISTIKGECLKINGGFCNQAYLQNGDEIIIGHNKIKFLKQEKVEGSHIDTPPVYLSNLNILIEGETGVGKSTLAKEIHEKSGNLGQFVQINLSSFPVSLIESELFGHVKGAFTGAVRDKEGAFIQARGGTLFLDEIDSLPLEIQVKLLLFLDDKKVRPVGSTENIKCDTRIVFASGSCLKGLVGKGRMRKDFFFRVTSGHCLKLPALRDCSKTLNLALYSYEMKNDVLLSQSLKKYISKQRWPGNLRQLYGHLDKKRALSKNRKLDLDETESELLDIEIELDENVFLLPFREVKKRYFNHALSKCHSDLNLTAKRIGVSVNTVKKFTR